jgi:hypothetical protein
MIARAAVSCSFSGRFRSTSIACLRASVIPPQYITCWSRGTSASWIATLPGVLGPADDICTLLRQTRAH